MARVHIPNNYKRMDLLTWYNTNDGEFTHYFLYGDLLYVQALSKILCLSNNKVYHGIEDLMTLDEAANTYIIPIANEDIEIFVRSGD